MQYKWRVLIAVGFGSFMATLDFGIINLALPSLAVEFDEPPDVVVWAALTHSLVVTGLTLTAGRAGDLYGRKRVYLAGWSVFTVGLCASPFADSIGQLIATRFFQAIGMSMAIANSNAIVIDAFPDAERGRALGVVTSIVGAGLMAGPAVGGFILSALDWQAIFYLRIPIGVIVLAVGWRQVRESGGAGGSGGRLDLPGALSMFVALTALLVAINRGASWGWTSPATLGLGAAGCALLAVFLRIESGSASPILSLELFRVRGFAVPLACIVLLFMSQACVNFALPFYLIEARGFSPARSGLIVSTVPLMLLLLAPLSGLLADRHASRIQPTVGLVCSTVGLFMLTTLGDASSVAGIVARLGLIGVGMSTFGPANSSSIFASISRDRHGTASASIATARNTGTALGLGIYSVVLVGAEGLMPGVTSAFVVAAGIGVGAVAMSLSRASSAPELSAPASR